MNYLDSGPVAADAPLLLLAHGAGAPMDSEFMHNMAELLAGLGVCLRRFEFPYMQQRRLTGSRRPPDKQEVLLQCWRDVIHDVNLRDRHKLVIGGKSMGGRMACLLADEQQVAGLVCLGYPFHPAGKPEQLRTAHLYELTTPTLIVQGSRDALGSREEVAAYELSTQIECLWLEDGDHDLKPRLKSGYTHAQHLQAAAEAIAGFMLRVGC